MARLGRRKGILLALLLALVVVGGGAIWQFSQPAGELMPQAVTALRSDARVAVERGSWILFRPLNAEPLGGYIFYPGGRVLPDAYAPMGRALAEEGYLVAIPSMPLNLAVLDPDAASEIMAAHPPGIKWVIGGHSLGGAMAARYAHNNPERVAGLVIVAAYPEQGVDLSGLDLPVATIYAELDGLATVDEIEASFKLLPADALRIEIKGGNHAGFGWYGAQDGDRAASISREAQGEALAAATIDILQRATE